ncbi:GNAT family protein [Acaryochloris sp. IP29b_bin.137]|uniref:GNAT family N-acetyltransferase n=1 Tax=Acaryochloris sp. IP29b_bin.137 TaxID=2969217 RepID=UPI0026127972|nr:GNAT family protein [Acaryochloris sp. IP29b_bin.137]
MITLRDYERTDLDSLLALANNKRVSRYLVYTFPYPYTRADAEWWISEGVKAEESVTKVIEYNGAFTGSIGLTRQAGWRDHLAEIGYWLGEPFWGKGIATQAVQQMTDHAFSDLQLQKLYAPILAPNKASMRVVEKCGYELEGVLKREVFKDGRYYDIHHFAKVWKT